MPASRDAVTAALLLLSAAASAGPLSGQQKAALTRPEARFEEPFTSLSSLRELAGGKVLVSDSRDKLVQVIDFASGSAEKIGREGSGPAEYGVPTALFPMPDGTTLLQDLLNRRYLVLGPDGRPTGNPIATPSLAPAGPAGGPPGGMRLGFANAQGVDGRGRLYFQPPSFTAEGTTPDSGAIVRWTPEAAASSEPTRTETVAHVKLPKGGQTSSNRGGQVRITIGAPRVFTAQELWGVDAAGRIARVSADPYQVTWIAGGRATSGPVVPYKAPKVTQADKDEYLEAQRRNPPQMMTVRVGPGGAERQMGPPPAGSMPEPEFAETKPPFSGQGSVMVTPDGEVWVRRNRPAGDKIPTYDVFDRNGVLSRSVALNPKSRVVGFGTGTVYVVRSDEDDLQYLERYRRP